MVYNEKKKISNMRYNAKAYDRINLQVRKGEKELFREQAERKGLSLNGYIVDLIKKDMEGTKNV